MQNYDQISNTRRCPARHGRLLATLEDAPTNSLEFDCLLLVGEPASSPPVAVLPIVFVDSNQTIDLGTVTVQPSLGVHKLQAIVGLVVQQILSSLARTCRARRSLLKEGPDLTATVAREGSWLLGPRHRPPLPRREERGGYGYGSGDHTRRADAGEDQSEASPPTDLAFLASNPSPEAVMFRVSYYEA
uniref:DUF7138 domain-containing protein n=1 Tax=Oryza meridionalis TaxID=40149 RepID=A0A0E0DCX4_9ORYZ